MKDALPWIMSAMTITSAWMAGSKHRATWAVSIANQALWLTWICLSQTWGLLPMNAAMWFIAIRNHVRWNRTNHPTKA